VTVTGGKRCVVCGGDKRGSLTCPACTECDCGTCMVPHAPGKHPDCEMYDHHCESCHERKICTKAECVSRR